VLRGVLEFLKPRKTLEYGMGLFSTPMILAYGSSLVSIEMQDKCWYDQLVATKPKSPEFLPLLLLGNDAGLTYIRGLTEGFDLVFVDGINRHVVVLDALTRSDTVMMHDSQGTVFRKLQYQGMVVGADVAIVVFNLNPPQPATTVLTRRKDLASFLVREGGILED